MLYIQNDGKQTNLCRFNIKRIDTKCQFALKNKYPEFY